MGWSHPDNGKIAEVTMNRIPVSLIGVLLIASILTAFLYCSIALAETCERWVAKAVSVQGSVQALRTGEKQWRPVKLNDAFCPGDRIRAKEQRP